MSHGANARFGFETGFTMVHGLWQGPFAVTQDWLTVAYRMQLLGFNTIRLPMSFPVIGPLVLHCKFLTISLPLFMSSRHLRLHVTPQHVRNLPMVLLAELVLGAKHMQPPSLRTYSGCWQALFITAPASFTTMCTPSALASVAASVVEPGDTVPANITFPTQVLMQSLRCWQSMVQCTT